MPKKLSYQSSGVDISAADATKKKMAASLETNNPLVLNQIGAFASLVDGKFPGYEHPVLVCKTEEPGSKQLIAFKYKRTKGICLDLINHLINDVIVMGATPLFIQDLIVCGKLDKTIVNQLVKDMALACKAQGAVLTGGETSEQPGVLQAGTYVLGASCIGVVEKSKIIDGSAIKAGDTVLALASSGLHTNGYTLVRALMKEHPEILEEKVGDESFLDAILTPHRCYYQWLKGLFGNPALHGMAHITGGGFFDKIPRILPAGTCAQIDLGSWRMPRVFKWLQEASGAPVSEMYRTFNMGIGYIVVTRAAAAVKTVDALKKLGVDSWIIGRITKGRGVCVQ